MRNLMRLFFAVALVAGIGTHAQADLSIDQAPTEMLGTDPGDTFIPGMAPMVDDGDLVGFFPSMQVPGLLPGTAYDTDAFSQDIPNDPFAPMAPVPPGVLVSIDDGDIGPGAGPPDNATELFWSPVPAAGFSLATKATESFLGMLADPPPIGLDDDVDAYEDRFLPGPGVGAYFSADFDAPAGLDPGDIYWSPLWTPAPPVMVCDDVTGMVISPSEMTAVDVDAVHLVPTPVCGMYGLPGGPLCFLFSVDNAPPPPGPTAVDPGDIYITDCVTGSALFLDDVTQMGIVPPPDEFTVFDIDSISVPDISPVCELDGDGFFDAACGGADCDDTDPNTYPGAPELCDNRDNDCDSVLPPNEADLDADQYVQCSPYVGTNPGILGGNDCDDNDPSTYPGAPELCDAKDNDCDLSVPPEEGDDDSDQYVECSPWVGTLGGIVGGNDCDDADASVNPGAVESTANGNCADSIDNDCDLLVDGADSGCGGGSCAATPAEASVAATPYRPERGILGLLPFLAIPVAAAIGILLLRRRK